jgi:hypothetical protein
MMKWYQLQISTGADILATVMILGDLDAIDARSSWVFIAHRLSHLFLQI